MDHSLYKTGDADVPDVLTDRNGEVVLTLCRVCGGAEGAMPTDCPAKVIGVDRLDEIFAGRLDFTAGEWVTPNAEITSG